MPGNFGCFILIILDFDWKNKLVISMLMMNFEVIVSQYSSLKLASLNHTAKLSQCLQSSFDIFML